MHTYILQSPDGTNYTVRVDYPIDVYRGILANLAVSDPLTWTGWAVVREIGAYALDPSRVYRFIMSTPNNINGRIDTGASYPGCSVENPSACQPQQFYTIDDAVTYALSHSEIPVMVASADEAYGIIAGTIPLDASKIVTAPTVNVGGWVWVVGGLGAAWWLLRRGKSA